MEDSGSQAVGSTGFVMRSLSFGRCALVASTLMRTLTLSKVRSVQLGERRVSSASSKTKGFFAPDSHT